MHRISHDTADANLNGFGKAGFTGGNPATGVLSTRLTPEWCNALQEEIANTVEAAGLTLDPANNSQMAQAVQALASSYAFSGTWPDITGKPTFAPVATSGAYGDLSGKPDLSDVLRTSSLLSSTLVESGACGPAVTHIAIEDKVIGTFGNTQGHQQYPDFNHTPNAWGWSYVYGTANRPPVGGSQGGYRCRVSIGAGYGNHAMELCYGRPSAGGDGYTPYVRHAAYDSWSSWKKINAGNADTIGGMSASQLIQMGRVKKWLHLEPAGNTIRDSYGISSITDHGVGQWTIRFSTYFSSTGYAPAGFSHGDSGYIESVGAEAEYSPYWGTDALRIAHKVTGLANYCDGSHVTMSFVGNE